MKWRKSFFVVMLVGMMVFAMISCGRTEDPTPAIDQPVPAAEDTKPAPSEGIVPDEKRPVRELDLVTAAAKLRLTEQQLRDALGDLSQGPPNLAAAAEQLGISEASLREALGLPEGGPPLGSSGPEGKRR